VVIGGVCQISKRNDRPTAENRRVAAGLAAETRA